MTPLVVYQSDGTPVRELVDYSLDLAWGVGQNSENDFELQCPEKLAPGMIIGIDGTEAGGTIDTVTTTLKSGKRTISYKGRTWSGVIASHILQPPSGQDYWTANGAVGQAVASILSLTAEKITSGGGSEPLIEFAPTSAELPEGWRGESSYGEQNPNGITPPLANPWVRTLNKGAWFAGPSFQAHEGQKITVTLVASYWTATSNRAIGIAIEYANGDRQTVVHTDPTKAPARQWVTTTATISLKHDTSAHVFVANIGGNPTRIAYLSVSSAVD